MNADTITIDSEDKGFVLRVETDEGETFSFNIHGIAEQVYDTVKREIGPWLQERDLAKASYDRGEGPNGEPPGTWPEGFRWSYRCVDPEGLWIRDSEAMADAADLQRKQAKGE